LCVVLGKRFLHYIIAPIVVVTVLLITAREEMYKHNAKGVGGQVRYLNKD